jgi:intracellular multiplication protein IcmD
MMRSCVTKKCLMVWLKVFSTLLAMGGLFYVAGAYAADAKGIGGMATNVATAFKPVGKMLIGMSYLCGIGFAMAGIFKFKQHKDNPTQIPVGTPIALMFIGVALVFLPAFFKLGGDTMGLTAKSAGGFTGSGADSIPGGPGS